MYNKKNPRLKLIFPCKFEYHSPYDTHSVVYSIPYGIAVLTAFLKEHKYHVEQEDLAIKFNYYDKASSISSVFQSNINLDISTHEKEINSFLESGKTKGNLDSFIKKISDSINIEDFVVVGLSVNSLLQFIFALMLSKEIKQRTDAAIVFGGPFISLYGSLYPRAFNFIDYMIIGDGRIPLLKLIDYLQGKAILHEIPNLIYRHNDKIISNPKEYYPLEDIPMPDFAGLPLNLYKRPLFGYSYSAILPYQISRSCSGTCSFCNNAYINRKVEFKSYKKVLNELIQMRERYNSKLFYFCDDTVNISYEYLEGLCNTFIDNKLDINWDTQAKIDNLDKHILKKMKQAGCRWLNFGIESGSDRILKNMNKGFTAELASQTLKDSAEAGIRNVINLICGFPHETQKDIEDTTSFIRKNNKYINDAVIFRFVLTYGSPMFFNSKRYGVFNLRPTKHPISFAFDEHDGLNWKQKQRQQEGSWRQIIKIFYNNARFGAKFRIISSHFFYYLTIFLLKLKKLCCTS